MGALDWGTLGEGVLASILASLVLAGAGLVWTMARAATGDALVRLGMAWTRLGLSEAARSYLDEWVLSWRQEMEAESIESGLTRLGLNWRIAARVWTLVFFASTLRKQANNAALTAEVNRAVESQSVRPSALRSVRVTRAHGRGIDLLVELDNGEFMMIEAKGTGRSRLDLAAMARELDVFVGESIRSPDVALLLESEGKLQLYAPPRRPPA